MYAIDENNLYGIVHHPRLTSSTILVIGLLIFLSACEPGQVPPTVDYPASRLDVQITVDDPEKNPSDGKVGVFLLFSSDGDLVALGEDTSVTCNGVLMSEETPGAWLFAARVPIVPEGSDYTFVHMRDGVATSVSLKSPERPMFISPTEGMAVVRSTNVTINYVAGSGSSVSGWARGRQAGAGEISIDAGDQPDNGTYAGLDTMAGGFDPGPGSLSLVREYVDTQGIFSGFNSVQSKYRSGSDISITWQ